MPGKSLGTPPRSPRSKAAMVDQFGHSSSFHALVKVGHSESSRPSSIMRPGLSGSQGRQAALALDLGAVSVPIPRGSHSALGSPFVVGAVCKKISPSPTVRFWQGCVAFRRQATWLLAPKAHKKPLDPLLLDIQVPVRFVGALPRRYSPLAAFSQACGARGQSVWAVGRGPCRSRIGRQRSDARGVARAPRVDPGNKCAIARAYRDLAGSPPS